MSRKPTYEELEQRVKELEEGAAESKRTEEELQESKNFLSNIFSSIQDGISILDSEYNIIRVNHTMEEWYSHIMPFTGKKCYEAYHKRDTPCKVCPVHKILATGQAAYEVVPKRGPGGTIIGWLDLYSFPLFDTATGQLKGVIEYVRDITERKQAEEALERLRLQHERILNSAGDGIFGIDKNGITTFVNPAAAAMVGWKAEELVGKRHHKVVHYKKPDGTPSPEEECPIYAAFREGAIHQGDDEVFWRKDGSSFPIEYTCTPIVENGEIEGAVVTFNDITERKAAEEALRASEERFRLTLDATSDGIWDYSLITGQSYYGRNWTKVLGYTVEDMNNPLLSWKRLLHPDDKARALAAAADNMSGRTEQYNVEFRLRNKTGEWQWILSRGKVVEWDEDGNPLRVIGTHKDISDRKRAENALEKSSEKIKLFAYSVAHDLKSPAIAIFGLTKLLHKHYRNILDEKGRNTCEQILKSSEQIAALVETINLYISTRETPITIEGIRLKEIIQMISDEFSAKLSVRQIRWSEPECLPEINADRLSILRVLRNFIDNALKYGGAELSEIEIRHEESDEFHILSVRDDGIGLKQEESKGIFKIFKRKDSSTGVEGTGLGLAIVKEIAEQHQGDVWIEHGRRKGITFSISISKYL